MLGERGKRGQMTDWGDRLETDRDWMKQVN